MAWIITLAWCFLAAGAAAWALKTHAEPARWRRTALTITGGAVAVAVLGIWWQPPLAAESQLARAADQTTSISATEISCRDAEELGSLLERMSEAKIKLGKPGEVKVNAQLWTAMATEQRETLVATIRRINECGDKAVSRPIRILDLESGQLLAVEGFPKDP